MNKKILFCLVCGFFLAQGLGASAATYSVCASGCNYSTIQAAVTAAAAAGSTLNISAGTYKERVSISKSLTLVGAGVGQTIVDGSAGGSVFTIASGATVSISGMTIQNGKAGYGAGIYNSGTLTVNNCKVTGNAGTCTGGAFEPCGGGIYSNYSLTVQNSSIDHNTAVSDGGGIVEGEGGTATLTNCYITDNSSTGGFGGGIYGDDSMTITNSYILRNFAGMRAGGIYETGVGVGTTPRPMHYLTIDGCTIANNSVGTVAVPGGYPNDGGGLMADEYTTTKVSNTKIVSNTAPGEGGGVMNDAYMVLTGCTVKNNTAGSGGGFYDYGQLTLQDTEVSYNLATTHGGGIFGEPGNPDFSAIILQQGATKIINNVAKTDVGGGIYTDTGTYQVDGTQTTISNNRAASPSSESSWYKGWGLYMASGSATITNGFVASTQVIGNAKMGTACTATTCTALGYNCGTANDGCGNTLNCSTCATGQTCVANVCQSSGSSCTNACTSGAKQCSGNGVQTCSDTNGDGCTEWGTAVACQTGYTCSTGTCVAPTCTNQCTSGAKQCSGNGVQTCSDTNGDGCTEWGTAVACQTGYICSTGTCAASGNGPVLSFVSPTDASGATVTRTYTQPSVTTTTSGLKTFAFNWNGTNYPIYDSSLVLAQNFNNNSAIGESTAKTIDVSSYANNGTISGATYAAGEFGNALSFNGTSSYVNCGTGASLNVGNAITIEAWIYPKATTEQKIVDKRGTWQSLNGYSFFTQSGKLYFEYGNGSTYAQLGNTGGVKTNAWQHVAVTLSGSTLTWYINGKSAGTAAGIAGIAAGTSNLAIGKSISRNGQYFKGSIDEVRVYNRALSANEIAMQYQSEFKKVTSSSWQFSDTVSGLASGTYSYSASATDTANNTGSTETRTLTVNTGTASSSSSAQVASLAETTNSAAPTIDVASQTQNSSIQEQIRFIQQRIQELMASIQASIALGVIK